MEKAVFLVYLLDVISLVGVVVAVFVFAEIFEQVFLAPDPRDFDQHLPVGGTAVVHITLVGIERGGLLEETLRWLWAMSIYKLSAVNLNSSSPL